ncbi:hypothetical protein IC229_28975 [Spirosoma sp. BT702]|uniref:Uncharacterized protein n=1 Tax=Spirosoma profusum TaxID=2771354 RepID=A0A927AUL3_9BACT|nr:hypothetical protein [Spirosoma profusum]MBD2704704.1 hypothetical protein [Spirosoma profusum]
MKNEKNFTESIAILGRLEEIIDRISLLDNVSIKLCANIVRSECLVCGVRLRQHLVINGSIDAELYMSIIQFFSNLGTLKALIVDAEMAGNYCVLIDEELYNLQKIVPTLIKIEHFPLSLLKQYFLRNLN